MKLKLFVALIIVIGLVLFVINYKKTYDALYFMDREYYVTNEPVNMDSIGEEIGQVYVNIKYNDIPKNNGYSNCLSVGTKIFRLNNLDDFSEIVVENNRTNSNDLNRSQYVKVYLLNSFK